MGPTLLSRTAFVFFLLLISNRSWAADPRVQIRSPKDRSIVTQETAYILVGGKVDSKNDVSPNIDIFLVLDTSGSTAQPAAKDLSDVFELPNSYISRNRLGGLGLPCAGPDRAGPLNLRNSILAAEIVASRRLLAQLNSETTRVGLITFGNEAWLSQPLTHDFDQVRSALDLIYKRGPYGGTNMVSAVRLATDELLGRGKSEKYLDSIKTIFFFTDGFPTRPTADCSSRDEELAIGAAQVASKSGISVHVFALGEEALSNPRAAIGIAHESGGSYTPISRPADLIAVVDHVPVVKVDSLEVTNETIGKEAFLSRLAVDGYFASAVPIVEGANQIEVLARTNDGSIGRGRVTVQYQPGGVRSLDLEIFLEDEKHSRDLKTFLERENSLRLEIERLGTSPAQIQKGVDRNKSTTESMPATNR
jgi:Mg-chelatase subunit ChlD